MTLLKVLATKECQHCQVLNNQKLRMCIGKSYRYVFDNGVAIGKDGSPCHMHGSLAPLLPFGKVLHQDLDSVESEGKLMLEWAESVGLFEPGTKRWKRIQETDPVYCTAGFAAGVPLEKARLASMFCCVLWSLDDIFDSSSYQHRDEPYPYDALKEDVDLMLRYLNEEHDESALAAVPKNGRALPNLNAFAVGMAEIRKHALATQIDPKHMFKATSDYVRFCALESSEHFQLHDEIEYFYTKNHCQALVCTWEIMLLINGLSPSEELRAEPIFATFAYLTGQHVGLVNDVLSLKKELKLGENKNLIMLRSRLAKKYNKNQSLQEIFDLTVAESNSVSIRILELRDKLLKHFPGNVVVEKCIDVTLNLINSHLNIYVDSGRYINSPIYLIFDN